ncbi:MAG: DUF4391 domain-containing protein [Methylobacteriaceae bacterium]|jgi:hypothetical protein|nr:DUF4391 domain-containing protein [Methylobacteriaceae bacterium]
MFGLPKTTELARALPKKAIFDKFKPCAADRQRFDADIQHLTIVGEVSTATTGIAAGDSGKAFYVVLVSLRDAECDAKNLALLSRLTGQNMLFVLEHHGMVRLAAFRAGKVLESADKPLTEWRLSLTGLNLDTVWENIIAEIGSVTVAEGRTLDQQILADDERAKLLKRVEELEARARKEKQPYRKLELAEEAQQLKYQLKDS